MIFLDESLGNKLPSFHGKRKKTSLSVVNHVQYIAKLTCYTLFNAHTYSICYTLLSIQKSSHYLLLPCKLASLLPNESLLYKLFIVPRIFERAYVNKYFSHNCVCIDK